MVDRERRGGKDGRKEGRKNRREKKINGHKNTSASGSKNCFKIVDQSYAGL